jgi:hypothetical protein
LQVITKQDRLLTLKLGVSEHNLSNPSKFGELTIQAEESAGSKAIMEMVFRCSDLEIKDLLTKSVSLWSNVSIPQFFFLCNLHSLFSMLIFWVFSCAISLF